MSEASGNGFNVSADFLVDVLDWLHELKGAWDWKKDEPRAGNKRQYDLLCSKIKEIEGMIKP